jgi:CRISPR-associated protein Cas5h
MKVLYFEIWGEFAHFRKPYTTTSPLTFPIAPRTAIAGILGALIGIKKYDIVCQNKDSFIALKLLKPIKKTRFAINLSKVANKKKFEQGFMDLSLIKNRTPQIRYEFLKDVKYGIYFFHNDNTIYAAIKNALINHESIYTPYLGISELIANFQFIAEYEVEEIENTNENISFKCVIPKGKLKDEKIIFEDDAEYFFVRMPNMLDKDRVVQEYVEVVFERNALKGLKAVPIKYWIIKDNEEKIIFL